MLFGWDIGEVVLPNLKFSNWERGFADIVMKPDLGTFAIEPWEDHVASAICDLWSEHGERVTISPRYVLQRVVERARALGFEPLAAAELEFRFFRETMVSLRDKDFGPNLTPLTRGSTATRSANRAPTSTCWAYRTHDARPRHRNRRLQPRAWTRHVRNEHPLRRRRHRRRLYHALQERRQRDCHQMGLTASFMAKWNDQEDGSSGHSHLSLWDRSRERNVFWDEGAEGHMSQTMRQFLAGVLEKLPECMALYAPVINSYKRYVEGTWAPLNTTWGMDNRTCSVRIINVNRHAIRIENRVPGADANFYLVFAATLASGLYGIEHQLELPQRLDGNAYDAETVARALEAGHIRQLARNLTAATDLLEQSELAREYFGSDFVEHYIATRRWEVSEYEKAVTNWDRKRYLELI